MKPRRRRSGGLLSFVLVLVLGAAAGAAVLSVLLRSQESHPLLLGRADMRVEVLNGCGVDGAAARAAAEIRRAGYPVDRVGAADHYHYRKDIVVVRSGDRDDVRALAELLDAVLVEQRRPRYPYVVTVIAGRPHHLVEEP